MKRTRRDFLRAVAALAVLAGTPSRLLAGGARLQAATPPGLPAIILARALDDERVVARVERATLRSWRDPGQLRTWLARRETQLSASPSNVAANLHNRGVSVVLMHINVWGTLGILDASGPLQQLPDLAGRHLAVPFRGDMPDLVLRHLLRQHGMTVGRDLRVTYFSGPFEAVQIFLARRVDAAVLPEPARSIARRQSATLGIEPAELDLQEEWSRTLGGPALLPQAGTVCRRELLDNDPELVTAVQAAVTDAVAWVVAEPAAAGRLASKRFSLPAAAMGEAIGRTRLIMRPAAEARPALEDFLGALAELSPDFIGGRLPDDSFYLPAS